MRALLAAVVVLLAGCGGGAEVPDATRPPGPCEAGLPGVRAHLTFDVQQNSPTAYWDQANPMSPLTLTTTGGGHAGCAIVLSDVGPDWTATVRCAYPADTVVGPASLGFYSLAGGLSQWEGQPNTFTADPSACVDAEMHVRYRDISIDAGVTDGAP